jgi:uncharacterized protein
VSPITVSLPIADRQASFPSTALGEPASNGVPEPLQFVANEGVQLMLVPRGGFGWVTGRALIQA